MLSDLAPRSAPPAREDPLEAAARCQPAPRSYQYQAPTGTLPCGTPMSNTSMPEPASPAPQRHLTLFDSTNIIVGIIIGSSIYLMTPTIAASVPGLWGLIGVWVLGGLFSLFGALCYTELGTMFPREGGDYVYLTQSYGRPLGFLFAWAQLWVVRPGSIGSMAYLFAEYANRLVPIEGLVGPVGGLSASRVAALAYAAGAVLVLSGINLLGVRQGKWTQNVLTVAKLLGLGMVFVVGLLFTSPDAPLAAPAYDFSLSGIGLAMIFVLFAYGGWNEMAYVGAEVRDPQRNIFRALVLGTVAVAVCYILVTLSFVHALGVEGVRQIAKQEDRDVATEVMKLAFGAGGQKFISLLICVSALGAINGQIFTGARIYYAMGSEHRLFAPLGRWHARLGTPVNSLVFQALVTLALVLGFGMTASGFQSSVKFTTPVFWIFMVLVGLSVYVLRFRQPHRPRPYRVPGYPVTPLLFCLSSGFMVYSSLDYAIKNKDNAALWAVGILALGVIAAVAIAWREASSVAAPQAASRDP